MKFSHPSSIPPTRAGFTLIEVMLVLIILVIIGGLATRVFTGTQDKANRRATKFSIHQIEEAIKMYRQDMNKYPSKLEDLWEKPSDKTDAERWGAEFIEKLDPDPWGNEFQYLAEGKKNSGKYDVWSNGPDGKSGTDDDIGNWE